MRDGRGFVRLGAAALVLGLMAGGGSAAQAASMKECSAKYKAAKTAGTLNGEDWKAFRAAQCGASAGGVPAGGAPMAGKDVGTAAPVAAADAKASPAPMASPGKSAVTTAQSGTATFPSGVNAKYASLKPGKAREQTCLDQYHANKAAGGNGGLKWIQKGGGYYSECSRKLKAS